MINTIMVSFCPHFKVVLASGIISSHFFKSDLSVRFIEGTSSLATRIIGYVRRGMLTESNRCFGWALSPPASFVKRISNIRLTTCDWADRKAVIDDIEAITSSIENVSTNHRNERPLGELLIYKPRPLNRVVYVKAKNARKTGPVGLRVVVFFYSLFGSCFLGG